MNDLPILCNFSRQCSSQVVFYMVKPSESVLNNFV